MKRTLMMAALLVPVLAFAQEGAEPAASEPAPVPPQPTAEEIKKVVTYLQSGKDGGPVMSELVACLKVDKEKSSKTQFECIEPVAGPVKKGTVVNAWATFLVPKDGKYEDVAMQWIHEGQVRTTSDVTLEGKEWGNSRSRTFRAQTANKPGKWEIKVLHGTKELGSVSFQVE